jgi:hypothetical protein
MRVKYKFAVVALSRREVERWTELADDRNNEGFCLL